MFVRIDNRKTASKKDVQKVRSRGGIHLKERMNVVGIPVLFKGLIGLKELRTIGEQLIQVINLGDGLDSEKKKKKIRYFHRRRLEESLKLFKLFRDITEELLRVFG